MSNAKHAPKRKRGAKAVPVMGAAGLLSLAGNASAATSAAPVADLPPQTTTPNHEIILGEEELSDVSLSTFYVFDKESAKFSWVTRSLGVDAAVVDAAAVAVAAAAGAAGAAAAAVAAVAAAAAGSGAVAASAKADHVQIQWTIASVPGRLDCNLWPLILFLHFVFVRGFVAFAVNGCAARLCARG